ncbi:DUF5709 domain-containing protein [Streptomyces sp. NPDC005406]|uniref:DUF5709 domain-containing protein n=1 Tax=Streptomyces sp. NPDC005406 TaxID=3155339 RepID=UPI003456E2AC
MPTEARGDDVYQPQDDGQDPPNDELDMENSLDERGLDDQMEEGYSPPERPMAVDKYGTTGEEERLGESLDQRLAQEVDDVEPPAGDGIGDLTDGEGEPLDPEGGETRSGRLRDAEVGPGRHTAVHADDVGIDGGAASAEEAAVHTTGEEEGQGRNG